MRIRNWSEFQHFKDRRPPWIKLHRSILEQRDINVISDCSFRVLIGLWLLASEDEEMQGRLPDIPEIAFRLRMEEAKVSSSIQELTHFLDDVDITMISERYQLDVPETETEAEAEAETKVARASGKRPQKNPANANTWEAYAKAYAERYGADPVRNAKVNGQVAQFVKRVGEQDAPHVAAYFLTSRNGYYSSRGHSVDCLLSDAEKLRTEWATGRQTSQSEARANDRTAGNAFLKLVAERKERESNGN